MPTKATRELAIACLDLEPNEIWRLIEQAEAELTREYPCGIFTSAEIVMRFHELVLAEWRDE